MLRLRLLEEGLDCRIMAARYGRSSTMALDSRLARLAGESALVKSGSKYLLAPSRVLTCNPVLAEVIGGRE